MKKLIALLAICLFLLPCLTGAESFEGVQSTSGRITNITGDRVTVEGTGYTPTVTLIRVSDGYIRDGLTGEVLTINDLAKNMEVTVYYTPAMTRSMPPQTKSLAIITGISPNTAKYFQVGSVEEFNGKTRVLDVKKSQYVTISNDIFPYPSYITSGQELLLWYPVSTLSMPGQATAVKAMSIYHSKPDIIINMQAGVAAVNQKEIHLTHDTQKTTDTLYLPVRAISEALGFNVGWNAAEQSITITNIAFPAALSVGSTIYQKDGQSITLKNAPILAEDGITLAPLDFFTKVLGATIDINNNHV